MLGRKRHFLISVLTLNRQHLSTLGLSLLPTPTLALIPAAITLTLQSRSQTSLRLLSRLTTDLHDRAAQDALTDRLRGLVDDAMAGAHSLHGRPHPCSTAFAVGRAGQPLTAPAVIPATMYFWNTRTSAMTGRTIDTAPAMPSISRSGRVDWPM